MLLHRRDAPSSPRCSFIAARFLHSRGAFSSPRCFCTAAMLSWSRIEPGNRETLFNVRRNQTHDNGSVPVLSPQKKRASRGGRCCRHQGDASLLQSPRTLVDGGRRRDHVIDEQNVQISLSVPCGPALCQPEQRGTRSEGADQVRSPVATATGALGWSVSDPPHKIGPEWNLHLSCHDSGDQIGLIVSAAQSFQGMERDRRHQCGVRIPESKIRAGARQTPERNGSPTCVRELEQADQCTHGSRVGRSGRTPLEGEGAPAAAAASLPGRV